jgi:hypothetical protein
MKRVGKTDFIEEYWEHYPSENESGPISELEDKLEEMFLDLITGWDRMLTWTKTPTSDAAFRQRMLIQSGMFDDKTNKAFWLFWEDGTEYRNKYRDIRERISKLLIAKNSMTMLLPDYIIELYISYHKEDMQTMLQGLPSSVLYDAFLPLIDANIAAWKKKVGVA